MFLGSVQRNYLRYDDLNHSVPSPERTDIGAFVVSRPEELSYCYDQRSFYFPYGPIVYVVEHSSAQFNKYGHQSRCAPNLTTLSAPLKQHHSTTLQ